MAIVDVNNNGGVGFGTTVETSDTVFNWPSFLYKKIYLDLNASNTIDSELANAIESLGWTSEVEVS